MLPELSRIVVTNINELHLSVFDSMLEELRLVGKDVNNNCIQITRCWDYALCLSHQKIKNRDTASTYWAKFVFHNYDGKYNRNVKTYKSAVQESIMQSKSNSLVITVRTLDSSKCIFVHRRIDQNGKILKPVKNAQEKCNKY